MKINTHDKIDIEIPEGGFFPFYDSKQCLKIWLADILYVDQQGRKIRIVTTNGEYSRYDKVKNVEHYLQGPFYHCLKTTVLNFAQVEKMSGQTVYFRNGDTYMLGRDNFRHTKQTFAIYLKKTCNSKSFVV